MKILWLINAPIPDICVKAGLPVQVKEGWISGLYHAMKEKIKKSEIPMELIICFPQMSSSDNICGVLDGNKFYGFYKEEDKPYKYSEKVYLRLKAIIEEVKPDVVHIAGTEYDHAYAMTKAFSKPEQMVTSIQGLTSVYAGHYMADLPVHVRYGFSFRDFFKMDNLLLDQKRYYRRGAMEIETIKKVGHVIGRTDWDRACTRKINPLAEYHHCGEILRDVFYEGDIWSYDACEPHSIFVSQGYYPIKGLHYVVEALKDIKVFYPDIKLYVAGGVTLNNKGIKSRLKQKNYQRFLEKRIKEYGLEEHIIFLPPLKEDEMKKQYMKSNVFVSASSIENSPNSLGEAMVLGMPCVASLVGGVASMLVHEKEGFTYQHDAAYMLAFYVMKMFELCEQKPEQLKMITMEARNHGLKLFDREKNAGRMLEIYGGIYEQNKTNHEA